MCDAGIKVPERPKNPEWIWKNADAPCWVTCCVVGTQQTLKQYSLAFPPLAPFTCCINPFLNPILGMLDYCIVAYRMEDMKFGSEPMAFKGNCCSYHSALCTSQCKTCLTCGVWFNFYGGNHVMPTYLDQHICMKENQANFVAGDRWQDAAKCKTHYEQIRESVLNKVGKPFDDHMYIMQNTPPPTCWEGCKGMCASFGDKSMIDINNQLRYVRIANRQLRFTGDPAGFNALQPSLAYMVGMCPCYCTHVCMGTYKTAFNQYIDNHLEWLPTGHNEGGVERSLAEGTMQAVSSATSAMGSMASGVSGLFGSSSSVAPESNPSSTDTAAGQKAS